MVNDEKAGPPTSVARRYVRYVVGFGVGVGIGILPLQTQLSVLIPAKLQDSLVPVAAFVMGVVAVVVQFSYDERIARRTLKRRFSACLGILAIALVSLLYLYVYRIQIVDIPSLDTSTSVIFGPERLEDCECSEEISDLQCIEEVSLHRVDSCWDTKGTRFAFILTYLLLMSSFGALIGFLLVREESRAEKKKSDR